MRDQDGQIVGYLGVALDITERKIAKHILSHLPPPLHVRLRREGAGVGVPVHRQIGVVRPEGLRLGGRAAEGQVIS